jgi:hypothetical protein
MLLVFHINDWQDEQTIGDPGLRLRLDEPGHAAPVERRGARSDENMIRSQLSRIWSKRRMYTLLSYPLTLT